jgi:hypothetical protein
VQSTGRVACRDLRSPSARPGARPAARNRGPARASASPPCGPPSPSRPVAGERDPQEAPGGRGAIHRAGRLQGLEEVVDAGRRPRLTGRLSASASSPSARPGARPAARNRGPARASASPPWLGAARPRAAPPAARRRREARDAARRAGHHRLDRASASSPSARPGARPAARNRGPARASASPPCGPPSPRPQLVAAVKPVMPLDEPVTTGSIVPTPPIAKAARILVRRDTGRVLKERLTIPEPRRRPLMIPLSIDLGRSAARRPPAPAPPPPIAAVMMKNIYRVPFGRRRSWGHGPGTQGTVDHPGA